jgi:hypothetical protein
VNVRFQARVAAAFAIAALSSVLLGGVVIAAQKSSVSGAVAGCDGGMCSTGAFGARYDVTQGHSEGTFYWQITNFEIFGGLGPGTKQQAAVLGIDPVPHSWKGQFLNASNAVVGTITPPSDECWGQWADSTALWWSFCKRSTVDVPISATRVKISVYVDDFGENGTGWQKTWYMPVN